jgi:signal transduction histidine kinase
MARNCLLLLLMCIAHPLLSQPRYTFFAYTTDNGMPSNGIKGMRFDSTTGFLWLATEAGLTRFNGNEFKIFNEGSQGQTITERMIFLFQNADGNIYTADKLSRLFRIQKQAPVFVDSPAKYADLTASAYLLSVSQKMYGSWVGKQLKSSIDLFLIYTKVLALSDTSALVIREGEPSPYYFSLINPSPRPLVAPVNNIDNGFRVGNRSFLTDADKNFYEFMPSTATIKKILPGFPTHRADLVFWQTGTKDPIYISGSSVFTIHMENGFLRRHLVCDSLPPGINVNLIQYNKAVKTLFIATVSNGLFVIRENSVESVRRPANDITIPESYYAQLLLSNGNVLTNSSQQVGKATIIKNTPITGTFGSLLYNDGDSIIWYTKGMGPEKKYLLLHSYHSVSSKTVVYTKSPLVVTPPIQRSGGNIYLLTSKGLCMLQRDSLILVNGLFCQTKGDWPADMTEVKPGVLGLATRDYVFLYNINTRKTDTILVNKAVDIRKLWVYKDYVFIGTYGGGIYIYHNGKTKTIPIDKNRHLLFSHCFAKDNYGYCWISSNNGLFKARLSDMIRAFESNTTADEIVYYHYYGKNDGMAITEMNGGCTPCALERQDKIISFPTMLGLLWVNPSTAKPAVLWNDLYVDVFSANGIKINSDSLPYKELPFYTKEIRLKIAYPVWENPENIYIQYRFAGDSTWKWLEPGGNIILSNPGYGNHTLQLRKINGFDKQNITFKEIRFIIATPVYATWWFYSLMGLCAMGLIYLYIRMRTRQYIIRQRKLEALVAAKTKELKEQNIELEKRDTIKTRLISIINHDIITPLKFLAVAGKKLKEKREMMDERVQDEIITEIVNTSKELQALSGNILNWMKYQNEGKGLAKEPFVLHDMINEILKVLSPAANLKHLQTTNNMDSQLKIFQYYDPLKVLIYNLVSNAINFTQKGSVIIDANVTGKFLTISVSDTGKGMTESQVQNLVLGKTHIHSAKNNPGAGHGLGYKIITDLLTITGAAIAIKSQLGKGTTVSIKFMDEVVQPSTGP